MDCAAHFTRRSFAGLHDCSHLYQIFKTATWRCCLSRETMRRWKILLLFFSIFFFCFLFLFRENRGSGSRTVNFQTLVISATEMKGQGKKKKQKCVFRLNLKTFDDECSKTVFETSNLFSVSLFIQTPGASRTTFARCQFEAFEALTNFIVYQISK